MIDTGVLSLFYSFVVIISYMLYILDLGVYDKGYLCISVVISIAVIILFFFRKERFQMLKFNFFSPVILFIIGFWIVHFQFYFDLLLGNFTEFDYKFFVKPNIIYKSSLISLIGLSSFLLGYVFCTPSKKQRIYKSYNDISTKILSFFNLVLVFLFIKTAGWAYINGGYGRVSLEDTISTYYSLFITLISFSIMILKSYGNSSFIDGRKKFIDYMKMYDGLFYISIITYISVVILSGDRGPAIVLLTSFVFNYFLISRKKMKITYFLLSIFIAASLISLLGDVRTHSGYVDSFSEKMDIALSDDSKGNSFLPITEELAGSVRCLNYALDYVPEKHPYLYGSIFFKNIISAIPFSSGLMRNFLDDSFKYRSSASFITWIEQGDFPNSGAGTTCIADIYIDFGLIGVVILLFIFGFIFKYVEVNLFCFKNVSLWIYCLGFILMAYAIYIPRSSFLLQFRSLVWLYFIIKIFLYLRRKNAG